MNFRTPAAALAVVALLALPAPATAGKGAKTSVREFTGTVVSVGAKGKSFRLRRSGRAAVVVRLSRKTRVAKGAKPRKGRKLVVKARRSKRGWKARSLKLVPAVSEKKGDEFGDDEPFEDEPFADGEEDEDADPGLDLEDALGDIFGEDDEADDEGAEEPE